MAQPALFRRYRFRLSSALMLAALSAAELMVGGCDTDSGKADRALNAQLDTAAAQMNGSEADRLNANHALGDAARDTTASTAVQLRAKALLADSELQLAQGMARQISANDIQIDRLAREISLLGIQIDANNRTIAAMAKYEPTSVQNALTQKKADVTGSESKPDWYKSDAGTLASLTSDDSQLKELQGKIAQLQDTIKSESDQRNQLLDQADKLTEQSQHEQKQKSVDLYVQGSADRKQAADLTVKLDSDNTLLASQQADLTVLQGQQDSLNNALKGFDNKSGAVDSSWKTVQAEQTETTEDSKKTLGDDPVSAPVYSKAGDLPTEETIGSKASAVVALAKQNHELRSNAETHFNSAVGKYSEAYSLATKLHGDIGEKASKTDAQRPDQDAFKQEQAALDPSTYRYLQADAQLQQAEFYAASAAEAKTRLDLINQMKPIVQEAKLTDLPTLNDADGSIADQQKKALASAKDGYKNATDLLTNITEGSAPIEQRSAARVQLIFAQYGQYLLEQSTGDPADAQDAPTHLSAAKAAVSAAVSDGINLPPLPAELAAVANPPAGASGPMGAPPRSLR